MFLGVFNIFFWAGSVPVLAPLPDIAVHVIKPPGIGREAAHRRGLLPIDPLFALAVGGVAVVVGLVRRDRLPEVERGGRARPAGVFPLGLRGQAEPLARLLTQLLEEPLAVVPRHILHGEGVALEAAGVAAHGGLPLGLGDLMDA